MRKLGTVLMLTAALGAAVAVYALVRALTPRAAPSVAPQQNQEQHQEQRGELHTERGAAAPRAELPSADDVARLAQRSSVEAVLAQLDRAVADVDAQGAAAVRARWLTARSAAHRVLGSFERALQDVDAALVLAPDSSEAHYHRARALAARLLQTTRARGWSGALASLGDVGVIKGELAAAIALDERNFEARDEELGILLLAPWPIGNERAAEARIALLAELDPVRHALWRAQALATDERWTEALELVTHIELPEDASRAHLARLTLLHGQVLQEQRRFREAAPVYTALLDGVRDVFWYQAAYESARVRQRGGFELEQALELLAEYIAAEPVGDFVAPLASAWHRRGLCFRDLGRLVEARGAFELGLALFPSDRELAEALAQLKQR